MNATRTLLDVRPAEPRHRFAVVMGASAALDPGGVLNLRVGHDPTCMYDTLRAVRPGTFRFESPQDGPEVWQVEVARLPDVRG